MATSGFSGTFDISYWNLNIVQGTILTNSAPYECNFNFRQFI